MRAFAAGSLLLTLLVAPASAAGASNRVRGFSCVPHVEGPVPVTATSHPFQAILVPPLPPGWIDQEFFVACTSSQISYETSVYVRRPLNPRRASGHVVVEPLQAAAFGTPLQAPRNEGCEALNRTYNEAVQADRDDRSLAKERRSQRQALAKHGSMVLAHGFTARRGHRVQRANCGFDGESRRGRSIARQKHDQEGIKRAE